MLEYFWSFGVTQIRSKDVSNANKSQYKFVYIGTILDQGTKNTEGVLGQFLSRAQRARLKNFFKCLGEAVSF